MKATDPPIVVDQTYKSPRDRVWKALTDVDEMRRWYFENIPDFRPEVGFRTKFLVTNEGREFPHLWKITAADPGKKIAYDWRFEGYTGHGHVVFDLQDQGAATKLTLTMTVREDFPDDVPEFRRESCIGGWDYFLKERLTKYLEQPGG